MSQHGCILIVDADAARLHIMQCVLQGTGHQVYATSSGSLALGMVRERRPWLVLLNPVLPDMPGEELLAPFPRLYRD